MSINTPPADLFMAMTEQTGQAFFAFEVSSGKFIHQSSAFQEVFHVPDESLTPEVLLSFLHPDDRQYAKDCVIELVVKGKSKDIELRLNLPGQEEQWVCLQLAVGQESSAGKIILGHAEDITSKRAYNDHLKKFSNKKNSVLNILSHDLAGPLGIIKSLSGLLTQDWESMQKEDMLEVIQVIERSSRHGSQLIQDFMEQEFLESSQTSLVTRRVNIVDKFREAMEEYLGPKGDLLQKQVEFLPGKAEIYAEIDDLKLLQVLTNLISNALKFTPDGGTITITLEEEEPNVLITVADTGVGIPAEDHAILFDKFTNARRPGLKGEHSIGLGMSIVKTIIEWQQGTIWFESEENKGTTFYIKIPKHPSTNNLAPNKESL